MKRSEDGRFVVGQSGNPSGRPKAALEIRDLARSNTEQAIAVLVEIMSSQTARHADRITAVREILNRGWGKSTEEVLLGTQNITGTSFVDRAARETPEQWLKRVGGATYLGTT